jgi:uncharacterized membrane protein YccC
MFWITALVFFMAGALVKLGATMVMVSMLSAAIYATAACLAALVAFVLWKSRPK